jgi:hypothetical protein
MGESRWKARRDANGKIQLRRKALMAAEAPSEQL